MSIYTKKGDAGKTGLFISGGERVSKSSQIIKTIGSIDEAISYIGVCIAFVRSGNELEKRKKLNVKIGLELERVQENLFTIGSILAGADVKWKNGEEKRLERKIDMMDKIISPLKNFILPNGSVVSAHLMYARSLVRGSEREFVLLSESSEIRFQTSIMKYINRLSDYIYTLARWENYKSNIKETLWKASK